MLNFNEFITESVELVTEAGERMTQDKWLSVFNAMDKKDWGSSASFATKARELFGIDSSSQKEYYKVTAAHKKFLTVAQGGTLPAKAPAKPKAPKVAPVAPKPMAQPKAVPAAKPTPKVEAKPAAPKLGFDTSSLVKKYKQLSALINDIEGDTRVLVREYDKLRNGQHMNNLETPDLYELYLSIESLKYTQPLHKEISAKLRSANELKGRAEKYAKSRK